MADNLFDLIDHPLRVHATAPTLKTIREHLFNWTLWPDFSALPDEKNPLLTWHEVVVGTPDKVNGHTLTAFHVLHTVPGVGYSLESTKGTFAFSGDTYACATLWEGLNRLRRLDQLMIEVAFTNEDDELARVARHFTPTLLGQELKKLKHKPRLYLTHHKPGSEEEIEQECKVALAGHKYQHLRRGDVIGF
jgi:ribonuclease BN (tRNA processing enzyme)